MPQVGSKDIQHDCEVGFKVRRGNIVSRSTPFPPPNCALSLCKSPRGAPFLPRLTIQFQLGRHRVAPLDVCVLELFSFHCHFGCAFLNSISSPWASQNMYNEVIIRKEAADSIKYTHNSVHQLEKSLALFHQTSPETDS